MRHRSSRSASAIGLIAAVLSVASCSTVRQVVTPSQPTDPPPPTIVPLGNDVGLAIEGRPLRRGKRIVLGHSRWGRRRAKQIDRQGAAWWARQARYEHASIAAFVDLAHRLRALDAPHHLTLGAHRAADDERTHSLICRGVAQHLRGRVLHLGDAHIPRRTSTDTYVSLAVESLRDGALNEGYATALAEQRRQHAFDPLVAGALATISNDEAGHAELAWSVIAWCLENGGAEVREALASESARLRTPREGFVPTISPTLAVRFGVIPVDRFGGLGEAVLAGVRTRLGAMLSLDYQAPVPTFAPRAAA